MKHQNSIKGVTYKNNPNLVEHQWFPVEYFSGSDVTVYFGDVFLSECSGLQFNISETVQPVFGYASHTWDCTSRGNRVVQGSFEIPFTEAGYLEAILTHIGEYTTDMEKVKPKMAYKLNDQKVPNWCADYKMDVEGLFNKFDPGAKSVSRGVMIVPGAFSEQVANVKKAMTDRVGYQHTPLSDLVSSMYGEITPSTCKLLEREAQQNDETRRKLDQAIQQTLNLIFTKDENRRFENKETSYAEHGQTVTRKLTQLRVDAHYDSISSDSLLTLLKWFRYDKLNELTYENTKRYDFGDMVMIDQPIIMFLLGIGDKRKYDAQLFLQITAYQKKTHRKMTGELRDKDLPTDEVIGTSGNKPKPTYGEDGSLTRWEDRISRYEKEVWGRDFSADVERKFQTYFYTDRYRNADKDGSIMLKKHGFDIYITYGPAVEAQRYAAWQTEKPAEAEAISSYSFKTTVKAIRNVQITGCHQRIGPDGTPISERYEFIAKDLD